MEVSVSVDGAIKSFNTFTYTAVTEVPIITSLSASTLSVYGVWLCCAEERERRDERMDERKTTLE